MYPVLFHLGPLLVPSYGVAVALGVLAALALAQWTARRCGLAAGREAAQAARHAWNLIVLAVFSAIAVERLLLIVMNLGVLRQHPQWLLALAMVHHPLLAAIGALGALLAIFIYARWAGLPLLPALDTLAAPLCLGLAFEEAGALLAGSGYGRAALPQAWSVIYTSAYAANWSGAPLGVALYPVQAYSALALLLLTLLLCLWLARAHRTGEIAGGFLIGLGVILFLTEGYRDWEGRGVLFDGAQQTPVLDLPQLAALAFIVLGALLLVEWRRAHAKAA